MFPLHLERKQADVCQWCGMDVALTRCVEHAHASTLCRSCCLNPCRLMTSGSCATTDVTEVSSSRRVSSAPPQPQRSQPLPPYPSRLQPSLPAQEPPSLSLGVPFAAIVSPAAANSQGSCYPLRRSPWAEWCAQGPSAEPDDDVEMEG